VTGPSLPAFAFTLASSPHRDGRLVVIPWIQKTSNRQAIQKMAVR